MMITTQDTKPNCWQKSDIIPRLIDVVCRDLSLDVDKLLSSTRKGRYPYGRKMVAFIGVCELKLNYLVISRFLKQDRTTTAFQIQRTREMMAIYKAVRNDVQRIMNRLG